MRLLLDFYGVVDKDVRAHFIRLSEDVGLRDEWATEFDDAIYDRSFVDLPWLEERAEAIRTFDVSYVPGLLQTPGYAAAILRAVEGDQPTDGQIDRWVALRLIRQRNIEVRVLPLAAGASVGTDGPFQLFELPKPFPPVAYVEHLGGRLFLEWPKSTQFVQAYDRLREVALTEGESTKLITSIAEEI